MTTDAAATLAAFVFIAVTVGVGLRVVPRLLLATRWHRPIRLLPEPVPDEWAAIVRQNVPVSRELSDADFERLLKLVQVFLAEKHVEGAGGFVVTEEASVTIAAQACLLLLWRNTGMYPGLRTVIVYPSTVVPRYADHVGRHGDAGQDDPTPILGQSWTVGVVILSWDSALHGAFDPRDGKNVVLHEFAHQLDQETGDADGRPVGLHLSALKPWAEMIERRFGELKKAQETGRETVLDTYGATSHAEFFAVATEAFFETPRPMRETKPDLYRLLVQFYGIDPAAGLSAVRTPSPEAPDRGE